MRPLFLLLLMIPAITLVSALEPSDVHNIQVTRVFVSDDDLTCSLSVELLVQLRNAGEVAEDVLVDVTQSTLNIQDVNMVHLEAGQHHSLTIPLLFREEPEGSYLFETTLQYGSFVKTFPTWVEFQGCEKLGSLLSLAEPLPFKEKESLPEQESWSMTPQLLITTMILVLVLFSLVMALLVRVRVLFED